MLKCNMQNVVSELSNQVELDNDKRWMETGDIKVLPLMLEVSQGSWVILIKAKAGSKLQTYYHLMGLMFLLFMDVGITLSTNGMTAGHFLYKFLVSCTHLLLLIHYYIV